MFSCRNLIQHKITGHRCKSEKMGVKIYKKSAVISFHSLPLALVFFLQLVHNQPCVDLKKSILIIQLDSKTYSFVLLDV
jgi:hypothetical protein